MHKTILTICLSVLLNTGAQVTFVEPPPGGAAISLAENIATGSGIYTLQAMDPSGNVPVFSLLTQSPSTPPFFIDWNSDSLSVPSQGLDAETATQYFLTFSVTAGSSNTISGPLTINVSDVNDNDPVFHNSQYTGEVGKYDPAGTSVASITAIDPDISNLPLTYRITGVQTTFSVASTGLVTLSDPAGLISLSSPTVLILQASDGGRTGTAAVTIYIHERIKFNTPPFEGITVSIAEDKAAGSSIYTLQATDPAGNVPTFTILTQIPSTPAFSIDDNSDSLIVPSQGLDAETATQFNFTFRVTASGSTAYSGLLTVIVTDVNDNFPIFQNQPYTGEVWTSDAAGKTIATITASDADISKLPVTYRTIGGYRAFSMTTNSGRITLADPLGLTSLSSPSLLLVEASDGGQRTTAAVTITIHDDPCSSTPCQNEGTCSSIRDIYTCTCVSGYVGARCQSVSALSTTTMVPTTISPTGTTCPSHQSQTTEHALGTVLAALFGGFIAGFLLCAAIGVIIYRRLGKHYVKRQETFQLGSRTDSTGISTVSGQKPARTGHDVGPGGYVALSMDRSGQDPEYSVIRI